MGRAARWHRKSTCWSIILKHGDEKEKDENNLIHNKKMERFITEQGKKLVIMKRKKTYIKILGSRKGIARGGRKMGDKKKVPPWLHLKTSAGVCPKG